MKLFLGCIYDSAAESYSPPFTFVTKAKAIQYFSDAVNSGKGELSDHPMDNFLFELGHYETSDSTFSLLAAPLRVICLLDLKKD
jgi:hypothetical protein